MGRPKGEPRRTGCIYLEHTYTRRIRGVGMYRKSRWVAEISCYGHRFRCRSGSYDRCQMWLNDMIEKWKEWPLIYESCDGGEKNARMRKELGLTKGRAGSGEWEEKELKRRLAELNKIRLKWQDKNFTENENEKEMTTTESRYMIAAYTYPAAVRGVFGRGGVVPGGRVLAYDILSDGVPVAWAEDDNKGDGYTMEEAEERLRKYPKGGVVDYRLREIEPEREEEPAEAPEGFKEFHEGYEAGQTAPAGSFYMGRPVPKEFRSVAEFGRFLGVDFTGSRYRKLVEPAVLREEPTLGSGTPCKVLDGPMAVRLWEGRPKGKERWTKREAEP